jgi:hypothetical protein
VKETTHVDIENNIGWDIDIDIVSLDDGETLWINDGPVLEHPVDHIAICMTCPPLCWISSLTFPDLEFHPTSVLAQLRTDSDWHRPVRYRSFHDSHVCHETCSRISDECVTLGIRRMAEIDGTGGIWESGNIS